MKVHKNHISFFMRCTGIVLMSGIILFFIISLMTYNAYDTSLFYVTNDIKPLYNMGGSVGAHCAALFFYLFGGAAFLWIIPLLFMIYIFANGLSFYQQWERLLASSYMVIICSTLLATYMVDFSWSPYSGGLVGLSCARFLLHYGDSLGRIIFLYISLLASFIICWRFSYMICIQWLIMISAYCINKIKHYHVLQRCIIGIIFIGNIFIIRPIHYFFAFIQSLYNGTAFDETDLIIPQENDASEIVFHTVNDNNDFEKNIITPAEYTENELIIENIVYDMPEQNQNNKSAYTLPQLDMFMYEKNDKNDHELHQELQMLATILQDKLKRFGISGEVVAIKRGPVVTLFEYQPDSDTKLSKIVSLEDDLAMALQAMSIRILAPIPGKAVVGFEVANVKRNDVLFSHIVSSSSYKDFKGTLPLILGKGIIGEPVIVDLARMPHLLIAGSTGSGKSVALNSLLMSLLCTLDPDELKLILIDPKRLEFVAFTDIAHLLFPIITSSHHAAPILRWVVQEMERRYEKMAEKGVKNCADYNALLGYNNNDDRHVALPSIVIVIDELADLMITVGRDIEDLITRITQMARAAGIHMIVATQRPSVDVITGLIKANFPSRISFRVASRIDSRTILDAIGADKLLGRGDMLFLDATTSELRRVHGAYVSDQEIEQVVTHIRLQKTVEYLDIYKEIKDNVHIPSIEDPLFKDVCLFLQEVDEISISLVQRQFRIGYNRSARIIANLELQGLIMPQEGGKMRKVIR